MEEEAPISGRARAAELKAFWLSCLAVALLAAATAYIVHVIRPQKAVVSGSGFDLDLPAAKPSAAVAAAPAPPAPAPDAAAPAAPPAPAAPAPAAPARPAGELSEGQVRTNPYLLALLAAPARFIAQKTLLGKPANLRGFLADPRRVARYVRNPVVRVVLGSPTLVRLLAGPAVMRGFLGSAAMSDPATVRALASSPLVVQIARSPGVQGALEDPAFVNQVLLDPQAMRWLGQHPEAVQALGQFGPAFAAASAARR